MITRIVWAVVSGLVLVLPARAARADASAPSVAEPAAQSGFFDRLQLRAELGLSGRSDPASRVWVLSPVLGFDYRFSHGFGVGLDWAFAIANEAPARADAQWAAASGPPMTKVRYHARLSARDTLQLYIGLNVPSAWLPRDAVSRSLARTSYALAAAARGLWNAWLWAPEQLVLALGAAWQHELTPYAVLRLDGAAAGALSLSRLLRETGLVHAQLAPAIELHQGPLYLGVRGQAVLTVPQSDPLQLSASAYAGVRATHWSLEASGLCNLDEPLGFTGAGLGVCGGWLTAGVAP
ncbi:MAG: hypothetical protein ABW321_13530 [Polyangiales bacterium]